MFLPPQQQQRPQPMFFGQDPNMQAQIGQQPQQAPQQQMPGGQNNALLEAMRARQMAEAMQGTSQQINATDPLSALGKTLAGGLEGWASSRAQEKELANQQAADKEITDALSSDDPLKALSRSQSPEGRATYRQLRLADLGKKPAEQWQDVDTDGDGSPDAQRNSVTQEYKPINQARTFEQDMQLRRAGAANNVVNVGGGGTDKQVYESVAASYEKAAPAIGGLNAVREAEKALEGPGVYGQFADERLMLQKVGALLGADPEAITNTETFRSSIAPNIAAIMKATVGSVQISNADREFAEKAAGGAITLDKNTIKRMLSITRRASEGLIADHKRKLDVVYPETPDGKFTRERALFDIKAPAAYAPKDPTQRKAGTVYSTPKGDMTWTGTGWVPVQGQ